MTNDPSPRVQRLVSRLTEGDSIDWEAELEEATNPIERRAIRGLKLVAGVIATGPPVDDPPPRQRGENPTSSSPDGRHAAERIGPYRLLRKLGEGGMGEVWEAEQTQPVRRKVAVKIIKRGMDTGHFVARFEAERQALALMEHPSIARVFDLGRTEEGRPFFVMELVRGVPITAHCDQQHLGIRERVRLFREVCDAVQHAHQKAVIHRDIKPSNVLVAVHEGKAIPKIIDFGVAKTLGQPLTERTLFTEVGQLVGTPAYMSPEQANLTEANVDTRTDVYSLGVLLYELLVGVPPFEPHELRSRAFDELCRIIREDDPPRPSTRAGSLDGDRMSTSARDRRMDTATLSRQLRGELDWITMKALEKDRGRRYGAPSDLSADLGRYLASEPVLAGPPTRSYRVRRFIRRHQVGVGSVATIAVLLVALTVTTTVQSVRIGRERDKATREADRSARIADFLANLFARVDEYGESVTAVELLEKGAEELETSLDSDPAVKISVMSTIGSVFENLNDHTRGMSLSEQALALSRQHFGNDHPTTLTMIDRLAKRFVDAGRYKEAEALYLESLERHGNVMGDRHGSTLIAKHNLAGYYHHLGRHDEAEALYREALDAQRRTLGDDDPAALSSVYSLAVLYSDWGRYEEAEALLIEALEGHRRVLGPESTETLRTAFSLAKLYDRQDRRDEAEPILREILEIQRRQWGRDSWDALEAALNLGVLYWRQARHDRAEPLLREAAEGFRRALGEVHPRTLRATTDLGNLYVEMDRPEDARAVTVNLRSAYRRLAEATDANAYDKNAYAWFLLTCNPADLRDAAAALPVALEANELSDFAHWSYLDTLALAYHRVGRTEEAIETQRKALSLLDDGEGRDRVELEQRMAMFEAALEAEERD